MGYEKSDVGLSKKVETWCIVKHPTEVAFFYPQHFDVRAIYYNMISLFGVNMNTTIMLSW